MTDCNHIVVGEEGRVARGGAGGYKNLGPRRRPRGFSIAHSLTKISIYYTYPQHILRVKIGYCGKRIAAHVGITIVPPKFLPPPPYIIFAVNHHHLLFTNPQ